MKPCECLGLCERVCFELRLLFAIDSYRTTVRRRLLRVLCIAGLNPNVRLTVNTLHIYAYGSRNVLSLLTSLKDIVI